VAPTETEVSLWRVGDHTFASEPFEGHFAVTGRVKPFSKTQKFYPGSVRISTAQPLGDLLTHLLEPDSPDSFLQWGFFSEIFNRTEYIEEYAIEPLAKKMLDGDLNLRTEFERWKKNNPVSDSANAVYEWFYARSPYVDQRYLIYPVGKEE
jgi:hypothetical protein